MSLSGAIAESVRDQEHRLLIMEANAATEYQSINDATDMIGDEAHQK